MFHYEINVIRMCVDSFILVPCVHSYKCELRANRRRAFTEMLAFTPSVKTQNNARKVRNRESSGPFVLSSVFFVYIFLFLPLLRLRLSSQSMAVCTRSNRNCFLVCSYFCFFTFTGLAAAPRSKITQHLLTITLHVFGGFRHSHERIQRVSANRPASCQEFRAIECFFSNRGTKILSQFTSATFLSTFFFRLVDENFSHNIHSLRLY